jgi:hypothetical protein
MKRFLLVAILAMAGCSQPRRSTYDLAVVNVPSADPNHRETQINFEIPAESVIQVVAGGDTHGTLFVDRLNSHGIFSVVLSVTRNAPSVDGTHSFTTLVQLRTPRGGGAGGPSTYTFRDERSLGDVLAVTAAPSAVSLGVPYKLGVLDGQPISLLVRHPDQHRDGG